MHTQEEMLQRLAGLLKEADLAPHLVASALQDNEVRFLQWVASHYAPPPDQGSGAQEGTVTAVTDGTRLVLQALRDQDEGLRARRRQLDDNVQGLVFDSGGSLSALDGGKIGLPRPRDRWWERSDKVFTQVCVCVCVHCVCMCGCMHVCLSPARSVVGAARQGLHAGKRAQQPAGQDGGGGWQPGRGGRGADFPRQGSQGADAAKPPRWVGAAAGLLVVRPAACFLSVYVYV